jgi:hypothetical protein
MEALLAFGAALLAFRLAGSLARRWRATRAPQFAAWSASLLAYALASAALAWGAAAGWNEASFRVYYTCGALLTAPLLGVGSLLLIGRRWAAPVGLLYTGLAIGIGVASPLTSPVSGTSIPEAQQHLELFPERVLAIVRPLSCLRRARARYAHQALPAPRLAAVLDDLREQEVPDVGFRFDRFGGRGRRRVIRDRRRRVHARNQSNRQHTGCRQVSSERDVFPLRMPTNRAGHSSAGRSRG